MEGLKFGLLKNAHRLCCAAFFVVAAYGKKYASLLGLCAPCFWTFLNSPIKKIVLSKSSAYIYFVLLSSIFLASCSAPSSYVQKEPVKGVYHRVKKGETFRSIARAYHVKMQDLAEINNIQNPNIIEEGSVIFIPEASEVIDDVFVAAKKKDAENKALSSVNNTKIKSSPESNGKKPDNFKPEQEKVKRDEDAAGTNQVQAKTGEKKGLQSKTKPAIEDKEDSQLEKKRFIWPVQGSVKTNFGIQPGRTFHNWIKIVSEPGTPEKAADDGTIIFSAPLKDYGKTIIVRHQNGYATVYTHLKKVIVKADQKIRRGNVIGQIGEKDETGDTFMNFEVRLHGKARNPLLFLPN
jgi:lipoprotein NlpD